MEPRTGIYEGEVIHARLRPREHKLRYGVFTFFLNLDRIKEHARRLRFFSMNKFNLLSFYGQDFGDGSPTPLREQIEQTLKDRGIDRDPCHIYILAYPRVLGYVFNPITIYYIYDEALELHTLVHEVTNTFHERIQYVIPVAEQMSDEQSNIFQHARKKLYVSPFLPSTGNYSFHLTKPQDNINIAINFRDKDGPVLKARFTGKFKKLQDATLISLALRIPLLTLKVITSIHFEALKLWFKGVPVHRHAPVEKYSVALPEDQEKGQKT